MNQDWNRCWKLGLVGGLIVSGTISLANCAFAQIVPDRTLGVESSVVTPVSGGVDAILGGATRGGNLFHSFSQFSVLTGRTAFFNNATNIQNIISRVTGRGVSSIDGLIAANGTANLFLINPSGIVFGPNASLNVGGSFVASTASSLKFADGTEFSANVQPTTPLLTVSVPIGLQFGGATAGISLNGSHLTIQPGKTLALVGGNVTLSGGDLAAAGGTNLEALGGRIELGSVAGSGLVSVNPTEKGWALEYSGVSTFGDIQLSKAAAVDVSDTGGGGIQIQGKQVTLQDGFRVETIALGSEPGGTIAVNASGSVELIGTEKTFVDDVPRIAFGEISPPNLRNGLFSLTLDSGTAGSVVINTPKFVARNGAFVITSTFKQGQGGELTVNSESVELSKSVLATQTLGSGRAGNLTINTGQLTVRDNGFAATFTNAQGLGGNLIVHASDSVELIGTNAFIRIQDSGLNTGLFNFSDGNRNAGALQVATGRLIIRDGAVVTASVNGNGQGGNVTVTASKSVELIGQSPDGMDKSNISSGPSPESKGSGGNVMIKTGNFIAQDTAGVTVSSLGTGDAGNLKVVANSISLNNQGRLQATSSSGNGGNIILDAQDMLLLRHQASISATAGNNQTSGNGGNIIISTPFIVAFPSENSNISEKSNISATAFKGNGGTVKINASGIFGIQKQERDTLKNDITASSTGGGVNGVVNINTPNVNPSNGLVTLPAAVVDPSRRIAQSCGAGEGTNTNQFTVTGRGGLPPNPGEVLSRNVVLADTRLPATTTHPQRPATVTATPSSDVVSLPAPATGVVFNTKGQVTLIAQAPTARLEIPWIAPHTCNVK